MRTNKIKDDTIPEDVLRKVWAILGRTPPGPILAVEPADVDRKRRRPRLATS